VRDSQLLVTLKISDGADAPIGLDDKGGSIAPEASVGRDLGPVLEQVDKGGDLVRHADAKPIESEGRGRECGRCENDWEEHRRDELRDGG
jgi:hypothetical protein